MNELIEKIKKLIEVNDLKSASLLLEEAIMKNDQLPYLNDIILLKSKIHALHRDKRNGSINNQDADIQKTKLILACLEIAKEVSQEEKLTSKFGEKGEETLLSDVFGDNNIVLKNINTTGSITINYNKKKIRNLLLIVVILFSSTATYYFLSKKLRHEITPKTPNRNITELDGEYTFLSPGDEDVYQPYFPYYKLDFFSDSHGNLHRDLGSLGSDLVYSFEYEIVKKRVILKIEGKNHSFVMISPDTLICETPGCEDARYVKKRE